MCLNADIIGNAENLKKQRMAWISLSKGNFDDSHLSETLFLSHLWVSKTSHIMGKITHNLSHNCFLRITLLKHEDCLKTSDGLQAGEGWWKLNPSTLNRSRAGLLHISLAGRIEGPQNEVCSRWEISIWNMSFVLLAFTSQDLSSVLPVWRSIFPSSHGSCDWEIVMQREGWCGKLHNPWLCRNVVFVCLLPCGILLMPFYSHHSKSQNSLKVNS